MFESQLGETGSTIVQFALALVAVIALIFLVAWLAKRLSGGRFGHVHGDEASMQVLDTLHIDTKRKLVLVRQGKLEHLLLIGGGSDEVVERSMIGGIPLAARVQATKQQEKPNEDDSLPRPADRFRPTNRFSRSLSRKKDEEETSERDITSSSGLKPSDGDPADLRTTDRLGSAGKTAASSLVDKAVQQNPSARTGKTDVASKTEEKDVSDLTSPVMSKAESKAEPSLPDEPDALQKSLDQALSESLMDNDPPFERSAPVVEPPRPELSADNASKPEATGGVDDLDLERELEAALELDSFEAEPAGTPPPVDLPPLPDLPALPDVEPRHTAGSAPEVKKPTPEMEKTESITPAPVETKPDSRNTLGEAEVASLAATQKVDKTETKSTPPVTKDPMEPSPVIDPSKSGSSHADTAVDDSNSDGSFSPSRDIPIELSGRSDPPISVPIPSRGPAASATTLAKPDKEDEHSATPDKGSDEVLDISAMLHPTSPKTEPAAPDPDAKNEAEPSPDDLDGEMRRLLGEIAGEPDKK